MPPPPPPLVAPYFDGSVVPFSFPAFFPSELDCAKSVNVDEAAEEAG